MSEQDLHREKSLRERAMDAYEQILHADMQINLVQRHIPHAYPKLYEECQRAQVGLNEALSLSHEIVRALANAEKEAGKHTEEDGLARKLLSWVERNRKELREMHVASGFNVARLFSVLLDDIEELCKRQIGDPRRAIFTMGMEYGEGKYYSEEDRLCGNFVRVLDARERALREAAMSRFSAEQQQLYSFRYCATEQLPGYFARKYIWRDIRPKHIEWLQQARACRFIDSLIIDYDPEQENKQQ